MNTILVMMIAAVVIASLIAWESVLRQWLGGQRLLPRQFRQPAPWGLFDLVATLGVLVVVSVSAIQVVARSFSMDPGVPLHEMPGNVRTIVILVESLSTLLTLLISVTLVRLRVGAGWRDIGVVPSRFGEDLKLGTRAFLVLAPIVYGLQILLVHWFESKHPLVELLKQNASAPAIAVSVVSAVVVAPVVEEYLFRVLLQGWLEKLADDDVGPVELVWGENVRAVDPIQILQREPCSDGPACLDPETGAAIESADRLRPAGRAAIWPVVVSSLVFSLLHFSHGPDWIPLFFLALGLGYLYRQTHRILPCMVVHFLLNASSMGVFLVEVLGGKAGGP